MALFPKFVPELYNLNAIDNENATDDFDAIESKLVREYYKRSSDMFLAVFVTEQGTDSVNRSRITGECLKHGQVSRVSITALIRGSYTFCAVTVDPLNRVAAVGLRMGRLVNKSRMQESTCTLALATGLLSGASQCL